MNASCGSDALVERKDSIPSKPALSASLWDSTHTDVPDYREEFNTFFDRDYSGNVISPSAEDERIARSYPWWKDKGMTSDSCRMTIMTRTLHHKAGDTIHIIHILENFKAKGEIRYAGPNDIYREYVNGQDWIDSAFSGTAKPYGPYKLRCETYDGPVRFGPGIEYSNAITKYVLRHKGVYYIQWKTDKTSSNILSVTAE
ncbi:MAG TPA: hypothetical protein VL651_11115 [Bacteroidia bacterium]|nr:hypothetical protein [Bacteroidia bacterium]